MFTYLMALKKDGTLEDLIGSYKKHEHDATEEGSSSLIALRLPPTYKKKFDELQIGSKRKFGKMLREVIKKTIDSAK